MPLIPKVIPKAGSEAVDFTGVPISIMAGRDPSNVDYAVQPLPVPLVDMQDAGLANYSAVFGNGASIYYPIPITGFANGDATVVSSNATGDQFVYGLGGDILTHRDRYSLIPFDFSSVVIGPPAFPETGSFINPVGPANPFQFSVDVNYSPLSLGLGLITSYSDSNYYSYDLATAIWFNGLQEYDGVQSSFTWRTLARAGINYSLFERSDVGAYLIEWVQTPFALGGPFTSTSYSLSLSDPVDDAIFQAALIPNSAANGWAGGYWQVSLDKFFFNADPVTFCSTVFAFEADFSSYTRIDVTLDPAMFAGFFMRGSDGFNYLCGYASASPDGMFQSFSSVTIQGQINLGQVFSLGCWSPCANLAHRFIGEDLANA